MQNKVRCIRRTRRRANKTLIQAVHTKVQGRARFRVAGLRGSDALKVAIESRLRMEAFLEVSASAVTGNVLIRFNHGDDHRSVVVFIEKLLSQAAAVPAGGSGGSEPSEPVDLPGTGGWLGFKFGRFSSNSFDRRLDSGSPQAPPGMTVLAGRRFNQNPGGMGAGLLEGDKGRSLPDSRAPQAQCDWHKLGRREVLGILGADQQRGLSGASALERLNRYGANRLPEARPRSRWKIFRDQFVSLPTALLGTAAGVSLLTCGIIDAAVIAGVVVANGIIGYWIENEAERTIGSLKNHVRPNARVIREGIPIDISTEDVVPGDIVLFAPGCYLPADCRVLEASHLSIDESALTGESAPVCKRPEKLNPTDMPLADRVNMAYMGTLVTGGEGIAVVVATGQYTEFGKLQSLMGATTTPETPIEKQLRRMGDQLVLACCGICGVVFAIGLLRGQGALQMLKLAVSLAAAALPEGLPAAATINFAIGVNNMRKHKVLVRRLLAIETIGAIQTVCLDKTGTLTCNRMSIIEINADGTRIDIVNGRCAVEGDPMDLPALGQLLRVCCLCSDVRFSRNSGGETEISGSPTETALVRLALDSGLDVVKLQEDYPLERVENRAENRLFMATLHRSPDKDRRFFAVKGSPAAVLDMCRHKMNGGKPLPLTQEERRIIESENARMSSGSLRVLGVAYADVGGTDWKAGDGLTWLGLVGMADPIRESAPHLIQAYHRAGIETIMITGDQSPTAYAVARQLKLNKDGKPVILDATELISLDEDIMEALAKKVDVYSRVSPSHKLKIVQSLQSVGKVVAMTGDGINDSPALKAADIGIAMGRSGTDVAREVADIVLQEDNLETLIIAVRDGRTTYNNIRKTLRFLLATNMSEIMIMFASMAAGIGSPLSVMQLLWINLISDVFPGLSLCMEGPEGDAMNRPPRDPDAPILDRRDFGRLVMESGAITAGALGAYGYGLFRYGAGARSSSLALQSLALGQLLYAVSCRSEHTSIFDRRKRPRNTYFDVAIWGSVALQLLTMFVPPLRKLLGIVRPSLADAGVIAASSLLPLFVNELTKARRRSETDGLAPERNFAVDPQ